MPSFNKNTYIRSVAYEMDIVLNNTLTNVSLHLQLGKS